MDEKGNYFVLLFWNIVYFLKYSLWGSSYHPPVLSLEYMYVKLHDSLILSITLLRSDPSDTVFHLRIQSLYKTLFICSRINDYN